MKVEPLCITPKLPCWTLPVLPAVSLWKFTGHSRTGFVMLVFCHLQKTVPPPPSQPCVMNTEALPLFPWALSPCCYTECVLLTKPVMDVGLPLCLCPPDKEASACAAAEDTQRQTCKHTLTHSPNTHTHRRPEDPAHNDLQIFVVTPTARSHQLTYGTDRTFMFL